MLGDALNPQNHIYDAYCKRVGQITQPAPIANAQEWAYLLHNGMSACECFMGSHAWQEKRSEGLEDNIGTLCYRITKQLNEGIADGTVGGNGTKTMLRDLKMVCPMANCMRDAKHELAKED